MASNIVCPRCHEFIPLEDVNVSADIALCRRCGENWSYADMVNRQDAGRFDDLRPPSGAWHVSGMNGFEVGISTRSFAAFFLVPFMCVWSGFSLGGIYGTQVFSGVFNLGMSLFGIPFVLGTLLFGSFALMTVCGKVVVKVQGGSGSVFTGVGPIGRTQRFDWNKVTSIRTTQIYGRRGARSEQITIIADRQINLSGTNDDRRRYMLAALIHHWRP